MLHWGETDGCCLQAPRDTGGRMQWKAWRQLTWARWRWAEAGAGLGQSKDFPPVLVVGGPRDGHGLTAQKKNSALLCCSGPPAKPNPRARPQLCHRCSNSKATTTTTTEPPDRVQLLGKCQGL